MKTANQPDDDFIDFGILAGTHCPTCRLPITQGDSSIGIEHLTFHADCGARTLTAMRALAERSQGRRDLR